MSTLKLKKEIWFSDNAGELKLFETVFNKLAEIHQKYIDAEHEKDCPYWYGERTHVGLLAAAVFLCKGIAFEEYGNTKKKHHQNKHGRGDLWIKKHRMIFECEAKRLWLNLGRSDKNLKAIEASLEKAEGNVKELKKGKGLAICFVTPVIHESKVKGELPKQIQKLKEKVKDSCICDALAWIGFAAGSEQLKGEHYYTGLLLLIKKVNKVKLP